LGAHWFGSPDIIAKPNALDNTPTGAIVLCVQREGSGVRCEMSDVIQAIDVLAKLIPQLKTFTGARRRDYFDKLINPLFISFRRGP
jgi:hypothetical protein